MNIFKASMVCASLLASFSGFAGDTVNFDRISKEVTIFNRIIETTLSDDGENNRYNGSDIKWTYLANQGIVTHITLSGMRSRGSWAMAMANVPVPPMPPIPVEVVDGNGTRTIIADQVEIDMEELHEIQMEAMEHAHEAMNHSREMYRELAEELREAEYDVREVEREKRSLEFETRHSNDERKKELKAEIAQLEKQKAKSEKARASLKTEFKKLEAEYIKKEKAQKVEQEKVRVASLKLLKETTVNALCDYGNSLRNLPNDENVTFIFDRAGDKTGRKQKDVITVFSKADIKKCVAGDLDAAGLMRKAIEYQL